MLLLMTLVACGPSQAPEITVQDPDTVVVLIACTMRASRLGTYGNSRDTSPYIDSLAASGAQFERTLSNAPWTRPAVGALVSGRYPLVSGIDDPGERGLTNRGLHADFNTIAEAYQAAGWATAGATANPNANAVFGIAQGMDQYYEATGLWREDMRKVDGKDLVDALLDSIQDISGKLFAQLVVVDTHQPLPKAHLVRMAWGWAALTRPSLVDKYDAAVTVLDQTVRRLDRGLARLGRDQRLLVLIGDHGEGLLQPLKAGRAHGRNLYDANLHVPWILHGPGVSGGRIAGLAESVDLAPTVLELGGVPALGPLDGDSRAAQVRGQSKTTGEAAVFSETYYLREHKARWTTDSYSYILDYKASARGKGRGSELYEAQDLEQGRDRYAQRVEEARALQSEMEALRASLEPQQKIYEISQVDETVRRQLEQLGYVVDEAD